MLLHTVERPAENEYNPFYAGYVRRVPNDAIFDLFAEQITILQGLLSPLSPQQADFRPGPSEWSFKEVLGHVIDGERVFAYRVLRISRGDETPIAGFEQNAYVRESNFGARTLPDLLEEFDLLRRANTLQFNRLTPDALLRFGTASNAPVSVRALLYIMVGHVAHHIESLQVDYLPKLSIVAAQ